MSGGPECNLLIGIAGVRHQVVIGADDSVDIDEVFWEGRLAGARMSHGPHSADKRRRRATTSGRGGRGLKRRAPAEQGFCQDGEHELVQLQPSWRR
jgi:hypothetical protein